MRGKFLPLGEWFRILPLDDSGCTVPPVHILHNLSLLNTWEISGLHHPLLSIERWYMRVFTMVYPLLKTLELVTHGVGIIIYYVGLIT